MFSRPRVLLLVACLAAPACFGGPTSDWPAMGNEDEGRGGPGGLDAGGKAPSVGLDAGTTVADRPCSGDADAGIPPAGPDSPWTDASLPDAGCR